MPNTVYGTSGNDTIGFLTGTWIYDDIVYGYGGNDTISGLLGNDYIFGGDGNDHIDGDGGNDYLKGGGGADLIHGGEGIDTAAYNDSNSGVTVSLISDMASGGDAAGDDLDGIENLSGSAYADTLLGDNGANVLQGWGGNDSLKGWGGDDTLWGGLGDDFLYGMSGADTLRGEDGNDYLDGGYGADTMFGGIGSDTFIVDNAGDVVTEGSFQGVDVVRVSASWIMTAGSFIETLETVDATDTAAINLTGNTYGNQIIGNDGHNVINGAGGADQMTGYGGGDTYYVDNAGDDVYESGGEGMDEVRTSVSWTLTDDSDVETLRTTSDAGAGAIDLTGNASGNIVRGNAGNNVINGGDGNDELTGLGGVDSFLFDTPLSAAFNIDVITDFTVADDTIRLDDDIFSSSLGLGNIADGEFVIGAAALDANDRIIYNSATGALSYDSDGNGGTAAIQFATLSAGLAPTNLDFWVVA